MTEWTFTLTNVTYCLNTLYTNIEYIIRRSHIQHTNKISLYLTSAVTKSLHVAQSTDTQTCKQVDKLWTYLHVPRFVMVHTFHYRNTVYQQTHLQLHRRQWAGQWSVVSGHPQLVTLRIPAKLWNDPCPAFRVYVKFISAHLSNHKFSCRLLVRDKCPCENFPPVGLV
jgi:hypothetical protein